ncbi:hypothetical protein HNO88_002784 [Novosphingobium chloroacetimidivorans]|uniref:Uncharacterized protein n=1 Tax=Novosphingobium chloroacetimidivorans TaxID=1428314 RepID=A0A7W7KBC6_9SPHN|nr:hypothetical protein [Novosphingobium chloroacetimidivorans]MBB4859455.1 hypothetical protein [Novosphingobium chloroacetimidivorans]
MSVRALVSAALVISMASSPAIAQNPLTSIGSGMAVSSVISSFRDAVSSLIDNTDDAVSANTFRTRQHLQILLGQVNAMAQGTLDKTFSQLTAAEQQVFKDVGNQIYQLQSLEKVTAQDVRKTTYAVSSSLDKLPFVKGTPMVMEYAPVYVISKTNADKGAVAITIQGSSLGTGEAQYTVAGKPCQKTTQITTSITFNCPASLFTATSEVTPIVGELTVPRTLTWWETIKGWFGNVAAPTKYTLAVNVIPTRLGEYTVKAVVSTQVVSTQDRAQEFKDGNGHCKGDRTKLFEFNSTGPEWNIYSNSVRAVCDSSKSSRCLGIQNLTSQSFGYMSKIANHGSCGPFYKDARGTVWGTAYWTEYKTTDGTAQQDAASGELNWAKSVMVKLPDNVKSVSISVKQIDGAEPIVIDGDSTSPWFSTEFQKDTKLLIIKPKKLTEALGA